MDQFIRPLKRRFTNPHTRREDDDDSERSNPWAQIQAHNQSHGASSDSSVGTTISRFSADLSGQNLQDHFKLCLEMFVKNKINATNVWSLHIFEYINSLLRTNRDIREMLQIAGTSLDIAAKIYSIRVDDTYSCTVKLAKALASVGSNDRRNFNQDDDSLSEISETSSDQGMRRQRRSRINLLTSNERFTLVNEKQITIKIKKFVPTRPVNETSSNLLNVTLPKLRNSYELLVDGRRKVTREDVASTAQVQVKKLDFLDNPLPPGRICPRLQNFAIDEWNPIDRNIENESVYDEVGNILPCVENESFEGEDDNILIDEILRGETSNRTEYIINMCPNTPSSGNTLEYSYRQIPDKTMDKTWTGPDHWKPAFLRNDQADNPPSKPRKKMNRNIADNITVNNEEPDLAKLLTTGTKTERRTPKKDRVRTLLNSEESMDKDKLFGGLCLSNRLLPKVENITQEEAACVDIQNNENMNNSADVSRGTLDISLPQDLDKLVPPATSTPIFENAEPTDNPNTQPPWVNYSIRDKKIDMRKLKHLIWNEIERCSKERGESEEIITTFKKVYKEILKKLSEREKKILTCSLAFFSLLHVASEHNLKLVNTQNLGDIKIFKKKG